MQAKPQRVLSFFDSTCIIVGIIIGAGIYQMAPDIARGAGSWQQLIVLWIVGGLLSFCGALSYTELAAAYREHSGGDYVYLTRAYGRMAGFLFGWTQLLIVRPGDIAVMAFAFATYGRRIWDPLASHAELSQRLFAAAPVLLLTAINIVGVKQGKWTQNCLTLVKAGGLSLVILAAVVMPQKPQVAQPVEDLPWSLALIFVLFTYGGWNEMAYVAAEVKNPKKNIALAMAVGMSGVIVLYLLINGAFLHALGFEGLAASKTPASDMLALILPMSGSTLISLLVCISALGVVNGQIFTGARISYALGGDHRFFTILGRWTPRTSTPVPALAVQGLIAIGLILLFGGYIDVILYTAAAVYAFYMATSLSVIVLRHKEPQQERPYKVPGYPVTPLVFAGVCAFLIYNSIAYAMTFKRTSVVVLAAALTAGIAVYAAEKLTASRGKNLLQGQQTAGSAGC
ncbi:MAG: amino acid permease [Planctomycetaceae bacterium]|nr:amino acid permease [Planctomycetaceae bacterium]